MLSGYGENANCVPSPGPDAILSAPQNPEGGHKEPQTQRRKPRHRGEKGCPRSSPSPAMCVPSSPLGRLPCLGSIPRTAGGGGYLGMVPSLPTMHINASIFGRCGAWEWRRSLSSPFSLDAGPLRQQAARACPGVTPRGGCGQEQGAHSAAAAASGQPTGWPGVGGREETDKGRERLGVGRAETETQRESQRQRDRKGDSCPGCTSAPPVPPG